LATCSCSAGTSRGGRAPAVDGNAASASRYSRRRCPRRGNRVRGSGRSAAARSLHHVRSRGGHGRLHGNDIGLRKTQSRQRHSSHAPAQGHSTGRPLCAEMAWERCPPASAFAAPQTTPRHNSASAATAAGIGAGHCWPTKSRRASKASPAAPSMTIPPVPRVRASSSSRASPRTVAVPTSDWAERLASAMSCFRPGSGGSGIGAFIGYSPYCVPTVVDDVKCVIVSEALRVLSRWPGIS